MIEAGDYVEKGQELISGRVPLEPTTFAEKEEERDKEYFVNAEGEVWALVPYKMKFNQERYIWGEPSEDEKELIVNRVEKTEEQANRKAEQQIRLWVKENLPETAEIEKKSLKFSRIGNIIEVSVLLEVRQQIAIPQEELIGTKITNTGNN
jgi:tRNA G37 N-methylase Trm5